MKEVSNEQYEDYEDEELKNIKIAVRWGKNGRFYVWENPTSKKINELIAKYGADQICDGCLWLCW